MPPRSYQAGDVVFVRAVLLSHGGNYCQIRIEDETTMAITTWAPTCELAKPEDIPLMRPMTPPVTDR